MTPEQVEQALEGCIFVVTESCDWEYSNVFLGAYTNIFDAVSSIAEEMPYSFKKEDTLGKLGKWLINDLTAEPSIQVNHTEGIDVVSVSTGVYEWDIRAIKPKP